MQVKTYCSPIGYDVLDHVARSAGGQDIYKDFRCTKAAALYTEKEMRG